MAEPDSNPIEGPFEGSRCLAGPAGRWQPASIRRANEDGTFTIECDVKDMSLMPYWYGVTRAEVSFDDAAVWPEVYAQLLPGQRGMSCTDFHQALTRLGFDAQEENVRLFWSKTCQDLLNVEQADALVVPEPTACRFFMQIGLSAKRCRESLTSVKTERHARVYWNQTRMGGREPAEIDREVTVDDALAALGLSAAGADSRLTAQLAAFEKTNGLELPGSVRQLLERTGIAEAVHDCHPNNPNMPMPGGPDWRCLLIDKQHGVPVDHGIVFLDHYDYEWVIALAAPPAEERVYLRWLDDAGEHWELAADSLAMFLWDLAQTGLAWYQHTNFEGGKAVRRTDIGLVPE